MFHDFLVGQNLLHLPIIALGIFVTTFLFVLGYVAFGWRRTEATDRVSHLPLEEDSVSVSECNGEVVS